MLGLAAALLFGAIAALAPGVLRAAPDSDLAVSIALGALALLLCTALTPLLALLVLPLRRPWPWALALALTGGLMLPLLLHVNVRLLPALRDPGSVLGNLGLAAFAVLLLVSLQALLRRLLAADRAPRALPAGAIALTAALAFGLTRGRGISPPAPARPPGPAGPAGPNLESRPETLLLISIDALRADHLGAYGYARETSPVIDTLAASGTLYTHCIAQAPNTHPSLASMHLGEPLTAFDHLASVDFLPREGRTLAGEARALGYATAAVVSNPWLKREMGFARGFERYDEDSAMVGDAARVTDAALKLTAASDGPLFLWLHYLDPHHPYTPPHPYDRLWSGPDPAIEALQRRSDLNEALLEAARGRLDLGERGWARLVDLYDGEIRHVDSELGRLLAGLEEQGRLDRTRIVLTADHGEEFRDHGLALHAHSLYSELLRLPLIVWEPGGVARRSEEPIAATQVGGLLLGQTPAPGGPILSEKVQETAHVSPPLVSLRDATHTLIVPAWRPCLSACDGRRLLASVKEGLLFLPQALRAELYAADLRERRELSGEDPAALRRMRAALRTLYRVRSPRRAGNATPEGRTLEELRALGYLGG